MAPNLARSLLDRRWTRFVYGLFVCLSHHACIEPCTHSLWPIQCVEYSFWCLLIFDFNVKYLNSTNQAASQLLDGTLSSCDSHCSLCITIIQFGPTRPSARSAPELIYHFAPLISVHKFASILFPRIVTVRTIALLLIKLFVLTRLRAMLISWHGILRDE